MHLSAAWATVLVALVAVILSFLSVLAANRSQRQLAHLERIGDRRIETYLELLKWLDAAQIHRGAPRDMLSLLDELKLTEDLRIRIFAFASDRVVKLTRRYQDAWIKAHTAMSRDEAKINERFWAAFAEGKGRTLWEILRAAGVHPAYEHAWTATRELRAAVRDEMGHQRRLPLRGIRPRRAGIDQEPV
jgi:hypothetical protein